MTPPKAPSSQRAADRPITFLLQDGNANELAPSITLSVRPEALSRQDPSRLSVQQTLGGAWVDSFGAGMSTITISGHTGWRRNSGESQATNGDDGVDRFIRLRTTIFEHWHLARTSAASRGQDPASVNLVLVDNLDRFVAVVAPQSFNMQRSRTRPLLMQYQISLLVLSDSPSPPIKEKKKESNSALRKAGLESLADTIDKLKTGAAELRELLKKDIADPVKEFMDTTVGIYREVSSAIDEFDGIADDLIDVATNLSRAGTNIARTIGAVVTLPQHAKAKVMQIGAAYSNAFCLFNNALKKASVFDDYDDVYGSSNCSSTSGGRALSRFAGSNTFEGLIPPAPPAKGQMTAPAQASLQSLARTDVALAPMSIESLVGAVKAVNLGVAKA